MDEQKIVKWAEERGIFDKATKLSQHIKTQEEVNELLLAIHRNDEEEAKDAIGDILVTLIIQAHMWGLTVDECLESAYAIISKRTGKMVNGIFVKDTVQ